MTRTTIFIYWPSDVSLQCSGLLGVYSLTAHKHTLQSRQSPHFTDKSMEVREMKQCSHKGLSLVRTGQRSRTCAGSFRDEILTPYTRDWGFKHSNFQGVCTINHNISSMTPSVVCLNKGNIAFKMTFYKGTREAIAPVSRPILVQTITLYKCCLLCAS